MGQTLNVAADGVLGNDFDAEGDLLTALLVSEPSHGSLNFNDDGDVTQAVTHTPHPTHASGFRTGWPRSSSASAASPIGQARAHTPHAAP